MTTQTPDPRVLVENIPEEIRRYPNWVCWRAVPAPDGSPAKIHPVNARTGGRASPLDVSTWSECGEAMQALERDSSLGGIAYAMTQYGDLTAVHVDGCVYPDAQRIQAVEDLLEVFRTYTEVTSDGNGLTMLVEGQKPGPRCRGRDPDSGCLVRMFDHDYFVPLTGVRVDYSSHQIEERQARLTDLYAEVFRSEAPTAKVLPSRGFGWSSEELIQRARQARDGGRFARLFDKGDTSEFNGSQVEAEKALFAVIRTYAGSDFTVLWNVFHASALRRNATQAGMDVPASTQATPLSQRVQPVHTTPRRVKCEVVLEADEESATREVIRAIASDSELFQQDGRLVQVTIGQAKPVPRFLVRRLTVAMLRQLIARNVCLLRYDKRQDDFIEVHPPGWLIHAVRTRGSWPDLRVLSRVVEEPMFGADGSITRVPGYDEQSGELYWLLADLLRGSAPPLAAATVEE